MYNCISSFFVFWWKKDPECCLKRSCYYNVHKNTVPRAACATINIVIFCAVKKCPKLCATILLLLRGRNCLRLCFDSMFF